MATNYGKKIGYGYSPTQGSYNIYSDSSGKEIKVPTTGAGAGGAGGKPVASTSSGNTTTLVNVKTGETKTPTSSSPPPPPDPYANVTISQIQSVGAKNLTEYKKTFTPEGQFKPSTQPGITPQQQQTLYQKQYDDLILSSALNQQRDVAAYNAAQTIAAQEQASKYSGVGGAVRMSNAIVAVVQGVASPEQQSVAKQIQSQGLISIPDPIPKTVTWQISAKEAGVTFAKGDVFGGLSKASYSGFTLLKESGDLLSRRGEELRSYSGFQPAPVLSGGGFETRNDFSFEGITARGESVLRGGGYLFGSAVKGLGSIPSLIGGVGRETPAILGAGVVIAPKVVSGFVKNPLGYSFTAGGKIVSAGAGLLGMLGTSAYDDPVGFAGEYAGASIGFGVAGKGVGLISSGITKVGTVVTPRIKFSEIASKNIEKLYQKGNLKALQYSDIGIRNVDDLIAYPKTSQAAKYYAQITGKPLAKQEGVVVRVMTQRTEGIFGRLFGKKDLTLSKPYTQYEIGSIFSGGVEPTGFPIKGLVSGGTKYRFSLLPKKPVFYDPNILLIKTKIGSIVGKDSISLLKKYGYDLTKAPEIARQNIAKVLSGKRVLQTRQIKGLSQKELQKSLDDILVAPKLSSKKAYPTVSEVIGQQSEAELTFIRGTTLQKTGLTSLGQRITGRTATTQFPTGGGKSITTDVELYKNLGLISKPKGASEFKIIDDIARAAREGYSVEKFVSPLSYESIASSYLASDYNVSYSPPTYSVPSVPSYSPKTSSSVSFIKDVQSYVPKPSSSSLVYPLNDSYSYIPRSTSRVTDYSYNTPSYTPPYVPPTYSIPQVSTYRSRYTPVPSYNVSRYDYRQFYVPKTQTYTNKQRRYDFEDTLLKSRQKKYSSKGFSKLYTPSNIENVLLPTKVDWLKAIGVTKTKQPKIETFKSLTLGYSGLKRSAKIIGVRF